MSPIRDSQGKLVCMIDPCQGTIEVKYKRFQLTFNIQLGQTIQICREDITTSISRTEQGKFQIISVNH